jgi:hypothetical protein
MQLQLRESFKAPLSTAILRPFIDHLVEQICSFLLQNSTPREPSAEGYWGMVYAFTEQSLKSLREHFLKYLLPPLGDTDVAFCFRRWDHPLLLHIQASSAQGVLNHSPRSAKD